MKLVEKWSKTPVILVLSQEHYLFLRYFKFQISFVLNPEESWKRKDERPAVFVVSPYPRFSGIGHKAALLVMASLNCFMCLTILSFNFLLTAVLFFKYVYIQTAAQETVDLQEAMNGGMHLMLLPMDPLTHSELDPMVTVGVTVIQLRMVMRDQARAAVVHLPDCRHLHHNLVHHIGFR